MFNKDESEVEVTETPTPRRHAVRSTKVKKINIGIPIPLELNERIEAAARKARRSKCDWIRITLEDELDKLAL